MQIIGHRGARGLAPENSKTAIKAAIKAGVDWVEFDVRCTKDGKVVLVHSPHTFKKTWRPRIVSRTPYKKLVSAKTFKNEPIATITEAFTTIGGKAKINVEIKSKGCAETIVDHIERMVKAGAPYNHFMVSSFKVERLREVHRLNAQIPLALLHGTRPKNFLKVRALRLSAVGFWHKRLPKKMIEQAKIRNLAVYTYTVNNPKNIEKINKLGVDMVVTDQPDRLKSPVKK